MKSSCRLGGIFRVECYGPDGSKKWEDHAPNEVVNVGRQYLLNTGFSGSTAVTTWYVGITRGTPTIASTDTAAAHAGWTEATECTEAARLEWVEVRSSCTLSNSASKASYTMNASITIGGAFLVSNAGKATETGTLMAAAAFTGGDQPCQSADVLQITYEFGATDA